MAKSSLTSIAREHYNMTPVSSWILGLTTGILITAVLAIDLLLPSLSFFTFPLIILPILFAGTLQHVVIKTRGTITAASSFRAFGLYYRQDFFGCFSYIFSFIKAIITFLVFELIISSIASYIFMYLVPSFNETINYFLEVIESSSFDINVFDELLTMNNSILLIYSMIVILPSIAFAVLSCLSFV